jgi:predicted dinucleotide-binding enzyme
MKASLMSIGVIGAGAVGRTLARHLATLGHQVSISNARGPASLSALAAEIGAMPASVIDAARNADLVIVSIPTKAVADLPPGLFTNAPANVAVVDTTNYHPELRDFRIDAIDRGMLDSQWVAQQLGRPVIKAFNNILATSLLKKGVPTGTAGRTAVPQAAQRISEAHILHRRGSRDCSALLAVARFSSNTVCLSGPPRNTSTLLRPGRHRRAHAWRSSFTASRVEDPMRRLPSANATRDRVCPARTACTARVDPA